MTTSVERRTRRRNPWRTPTTIIAAAMLACVLLLIVVVPFLPGYDPYGQDLSAAMAEPFHSGAHLLGTDSLGRDVLSRLAVAGRVSLLIAVLAVAINVVIGTVLGLLAGYYGRWVDTLVSGTADLQLAIPVMLLLIVIVSVVGPSTTTLVLVLGITYWVGYGRTARAVSRSLRDRDFVLAPLTHGASAFWIIRKHLLPNVVPQLAILGSFDIGVMITIASALDYLGLGVQPPTPSWGAMIFEGQDYLQTNAWLVVMPGVAIFFLVGGVQFLSQRLTGEAEALSSAAHGS